MNRYRKLIVLFAATGIRAHESQHSDEGNGPKKDRAVNDLYIVQRSEAPAVDYREDLPGLRATKPAKGEKLSRTNPDVQAYAAQLDENHD
jgi:hypothetical protein